MAKHWPTPGFTGRTFKPCVLTRWDFNFCVRSSPLRGGCLSAWFFVYISVCYRLLSFFTLYRYTLVQFFHGTAAANSYSRIWVLWTQKLKDPPVENPRLIGFPFKAWSRSEYSHEYLACCQGVLPVWILPSGSIHPHFFSNLSRVFFLC